VAATKPSLTFFQPDDIGRQAVNVWTDDDEWDVRRLSTPTFCATTTTTPSCS
jgi:hypothetical protein